MIPGMAKVAVVYATQGGLGDAGKFAAFHATKSSVVAVTKVVAMSHEADEEQRHKGLHLDVTGSGAALKAEALQALEGLDILKLDSEGEGIADKLTEAFEGMDAVVACLGSREPRYAIWAAQGMEAVVEAAGRAGVGRLVAQSAIPVDDFLPVQFGFRDIKYIIHAVCDEMGKNKFSRDDIKAEFKRMEEMVAAKAPEELDYLLVRPVGLNPREPAGGRVTALEHTDKQGRLKLSLSKPDAGAYLLEQAIRPTLHRTVVTIGQPNGNEQSILPLSA